MTKAPRPKGMRGFSWKYPNFFRLKFARRDDLLYLVASIYPIMKKFLITLLAACCTGTALHAQAPEFPEPEFIGQCLAIRTDNTTEQLVQESLAPRHRASTGQKLFGIGKDHIDEMTLNGPRAFVRFKKNDGIAFIIRVPDNRLDPMSSISVFRFKVKKKMRIAEYASVGTFGDRQTNTLERQPFTSRRFGNSSYLIILKGLQVGEYGITVDAPGSLTVSTFGVDK